MNTCELWKMMVYLVVIFGSFSYLETTEGLHNNGTYHSSCRPDNNHTADELITFIKTKYDKSLRPCASGDAVTVLFDVYIISIGSVNEENMEFTMEIYMRQSWYDPKLAFNKESYNKAFIVIHPELLTKIWTPDTYIENVKEAQFHIVPSINAFFQIYPDGKVFLSTRLSLTLSCYMDFTKFPMDRQNCYLNLSSYSFSVDEIKYKWMNDHLELGASSTNMPQYRVTEIELSHVIEKYSTGDYSRLIAEFHFHRLILYYLTAFYIPAVLVVLLSWVSFWINPDSTPARVSLGIITILTVSGFLRGDGSSPKVSYIKALDIYMIMSFGFVFASLLEYAAVHFSEYSKDYKEEERERKETPPENPAELNGVANGNKVLRSLSLKISPAPNHHHPDHHPKGLKRRIRTYSLRSGTETEEQRPTVGNGPRKWKNLDYYSRIVFPVSFLSFNIIYWIYFMIEWDPNH